MVLKITIETLIVTLIYQGFMLILFHLNGALFMISDYPPKIQERVEQLGLMPDKKEMKRKCRRNDLLGTLVMFVLFIIPIFVINGERSFWPAFWQSYIFFNAISWTDAIFIDCCWFCHSKKFWMIKGTEDMTDAYKDYWFHLKFAVIGIVGLAIPAAMIGGITVLMGKIF